MEIAEKIINYLKETYQPDAIIIYGSFADGSANEHSDFDALVIANHDKMHDASVIDGIILDVFIYPAEPFRSEYDPEEFIRVCDGKIVLDKDGIAGQLQKRVLTYIERKPKKSPTEIAQEIAWCEKMVLRTRRGDAEGAFRHHWVLTDSLEIYCDVMGLYYFGPKKTLRSMEQTDEDAFRLYAKALKDFNRESLSEWVAYLKQLSTVSK